MISNVLFLSFFLFGICFAKNDPTLKFENGKFTILQLADTQVSDFRTDRCRDITSEEAQYRCNAYNTTDFCSRMIEKVKPNLIVYTGDNISGSVFVEDTLEKVHKPAIDSGIPWTAVFGNHDPEAVWSKDRMMQWLTEQPNALVEAGPASIHGVGNFLLTVYKNDTNEPAYHIWMLDSGDYSQYSGISGYDWLWLNQIDWYDTTSREKEAQYGKKLDSVAFFHIPTPEYWEAAEGEIIGDMFEGVYAPEVNSGLLTAMRQRGDVRAISVGHDHVNDWCGLWRDIRLCYAGGVGYTTYGRTGWNRRGRVFTIYESGEIESYKIIDDGELTVIDDQQLYPQFGLKNGHSSKILNQNLCDLPHYKGNQHPLPYKCTQDQI